MKSDALQAAYQATTYRVFLPAGVLDLRIGEANAGLIAWLADAGESVWAVLTACSPASQALPDKENRERQARLEVKLLEREFEPYAGENVADDAAWPIEETCFVAGISVKDCTELARQFGQNAFVCGRDDGVPHLIWVEKE